MDEDDIAFMHTVGVHWDAPPPGYVWNWVDDGQGGSMVAVKK